MLFVVLLFVNQVRDKSKCFRFNLTRRMEHFKTDASALVYLKTRKSI